MSLSCTRRLALCVLALASTLAALQQWRERWAALRITLIRGGMKIRAHDVIMQHLRWRMGDTGLPKKNGYEVDVSIEGKNAYNVLVDHCSVAWGTDENLSISGPRHDGPAGTAHRVTLSNNIVAEGLVNSTHSKGAHSMGSLIHDDVQSVLIRGNLYTHNADRNPWFKGGSTGALINNFIYNPGKWAVRLGYNPKEWDKRTPPPAPKLAIIGNVLQHGADTPATLGMISSNSPDLQGDAYMRDNLAFLKTGAPATLLSGGITALAENPFTIGGNVVAAAQLREQILAHAGARPADRDSVDQRLIAEIRNGTGRQIDSQNDVGGYPSATATHRALTVPSHDVETWLQGFSRQ
uniref:hypothetical protein n=1 Tax=Aquabacterium sp. TaxID=1872578 RepID=UPI0025BE42C7